MLRDAIEATKKSNIIFTSNFNRRLTYLTIYDVEEQPPSLIFQDTLDSIILKKFPVAYKDVPICRLGCMVLTDDKKQCPHKDCIVSLQDQETHSKPQRKIKMLDIGFQIARMLCNPTTEKLMRYPTDTFTFVEGQYTDYFSGAEYQKLSKSDTC